MRPSTHLRQAGTRVAAACHGAPGTRYGLARRLYGPRCHLVRYHGVLAPNARHRRLVLPPPSSAPAHDDAETTGARTRAAMSWAQRLRRVFAIDISRCGRCGGQLRVLAAITNPQVIMAILAHLESRAARAPPPTRH